MAGLQKHLGPGDRAVVTEYLDAVRETERRIQAAEKQQTEGTAVSLPDRPIGVPETYDAHAKLMFDLLALAFRADITRVFTFMLGKEQSPRPFPEIGVPEAWHGISHHVNDPVRLEQYYKINVYQVQLLAYFLEKLRATPEAGGTLLDQSMVLYGGGISDGNMHDHTDLPIVIAGGGGGKLKGGRVLRHPRGTPMNNLLLALLDKAGVRVEEQFGDATSPLAI